MAVSDYSTTPADNTSISGLTVSDSTVANTLDNIIRQMMADIRAADNENAKTATAETITGNWTVTGNWTFAGTTIASLGTVTTADINGGTIDNTVIGGTTPVAGGFSTIAQDGRRVALELIGSQDLSSTAAVNLTGFDAAKYDAYLIQLSNVVPVTDGDLLILRTSANGGSSYDSGASDYNYAASQLVATAGIAEFSSSGNAAIVISRPVGNGTGEDGFSGQIWINTPQLSRKTHITWQGGGLDNAGRATLVNGWGSRNGTQVVNAARVLFNSSNLESGTVSFYGVRGA